MYNTANGEISVVSQKQRALDAGAAAAAANVAPLSDRPSARKAKEIKDTRHAQSVPRSRRPRRSPYEHMEANRWRNRPDARGGSHPPPANRVDHPDGQAAQPPRLSAAAEEARRRVQLVTENAVNDDDLSMDSEETPVSC